LADSTLQFLFSFGWKPDALATTVGAVDCPMKRVIEVQLDLADAMKSLRNMKKEGLNPTT
jgi:hypothetical protein